MALVQGVKEKVHLPLYDAIAVEPEKQLGETQKSSTLKFFVDVQGKTRLETNLQSASQLSHYNTYEARAMRVVISDLPPEFPEEPTAKDTGYEVVDDSDNRFLLDSGNKIGAVDAAEVAIPSKFEDGFTPNPPGGQKARKISADIEVGLKRIVELLKEARDSSDGVVTLAPDDDEVTLKVGESELPKARAETVAGFGGTISLSISDLEFLLEELPEKEIPPKFQTNPNNGAGTLISKFIYSSVTTLFVGEKVMIEAPTWMFPAGAGAFSDQAAITTHGVPSPMDTFRFAEAIFIDKQQNFRVEIEIPDSDVLKEFQSIYGPCTIWVILDGFMTRDVQ